MVPTGRSRPGRPRLWLGAALVAGGLLITAATWVAFRHGIERHDSGLPVLGTLPEFSLLTSSGTPFSLTTVAGELWIADFVFTQCPGVCPLLSAQMAKLQSALVKQGIHARLVSFTVDPANDTPDALRAYAERFHADAARWLFVTGERQALHRLIGDGFHLAIAERSPGENTDGEGLITHSDRFVLVDGAGQIRGYYHGTDDDSIGQLLTDVHALRETAGVAGQ